MSAPLSPSKEMLAVPVPSQLPPDEGVEVKENGPEPVQVSWAAAGAASATNNYQGQGPAGQRRCQRKEDRPGRSPKRQRDSRSTSTPSARSA